VLYQGIFCVKKRTARWEGREGKSSKMGKFKKENSGKEGKPNFQNGKCNQGQERELKGILEGKTTSRVFTRKVGKEQGRDGGRKKNKFQPWVTSLLQKTVGDLSSWTQGGKGGWRKKKMGLRSEPRSTRIPVKRKLDKKPRAHWGNRGPPKN